MDFLPETCTFRVFFDILGSMCWRTGTHNRRQKLGLWNRKLTTSLHSNNQWESEKYEGAGPRLPYICDWCIASEVSCGGFLLRVETSLSDFTRRCHTYSRSPFPTQRFCWFRLKSVVHSFIILQVIIWTENCHLVSFQELEIFFRDVVDMWNFQHFSLNRKMNDLSMYYKGVLYGKS